MSGDDHFIKPDNDKVAELDHAFVHSIQVFGQGEYVKAEHANKVIKELRTNLRHWRDECGKLHSQIDRLKADLRAWEITAKRIEQAEACRAPSEPAVMGDK